MMSKISIVFYLIVNEPESLEIKAKILSFASSGLVVALTFIFSVKKNVMVTLYIMCIYIKYT